MKTRQHLSSQIRKARALGLTERKQLFERWVALPKAWSARRSTPYAPESTFWMFLSQTFSDDKSCTNTVAKHAARCAGKTPSPSTGAYCKARKRLSQADLETIHRAVIDTAHRSQESKRLWRGRRVRLVDGSTLSMPDTPENQSAYPQPGRQQPGCGFPMMRLVVVFSLATGGILAFAKGMLKTSERALFRSLWPLLEPLDVVLADRGFCSYAECYQLQQRGVDYVMRKHQRRTVGITNKKRLGKNDCRVDWIKSTARPEWMTREQWMALPDTLTLREITVRVDLPGFRTQVLTVATSLLDPKRFPPQAFAELYRLRWMAELFLRDIKTSQGMDILRCKTPEMIGRELLIHLLAYNLVRAVLFQTARMHRSALYRLSYKTALATVRHWQSHDDHPPSPLGIPTRLLDYLAKAIIPLRPNRVEPRAIKRRPKEYDRLNQPRQVLKEKLLQNNANAA